MPRTNDDVVGSPGNFAGSATGMVVAVVALLLAVSLYPMAGPTAVRAQPEESFRQTSGELTHVFSSSVHPTPRTTGWVVATVPVGTSPLFATCDARNGYIYVSNNGSDNVSILSGPNLIATVKVGTNPWYSGYDPADGYVYVPNFGSRNVSVLNGTSLVKSLPAGTEPSAAVYDPADGDVYVVNAGSNNVSVLKGTTVLGSLRVGTNPQMALFDSGNGDIYVTNSATNNVTVINGTRLVGTVSVGSLPLFPAYDPARGYVYVPNPNSDTVSVLSGTSVVANVTAGTAPSFATYDARNGFVYVSNYVGTVTVLNGTTVVATVSVGKLPWLAAYDVGNGDIYVPNNGSATVSVVNGTSVVATVPVGANPQYPSYDAGSGYVYVPNAGSNTVSVLGGSAQTVYAVNFSESGLPAGTTWSITLNGTTQSSPTGSIQFMEPNGTYNFTVGVVAGYFPSPTHGSVFLKGNRASQSISFSRSVYSVTFSETGLPLNGLWNVTLNGTNQSTTTKSLTFSEPNGTYNFSVTSAIGYRATPASGTVTVKGGAVSQPISFHPAGSTTYTVLFTESGLPTGSPWNVTLNGLLRSSTTTSLTFSEVNGSYAYSVSPVGAYSPNPSSGSVSVNGAPTSQAIAFAMLPPGKYRVTFSETGLSAGTSWSVTLNGSTNTSTSTTISYLEGNGSHPFSVNPVSGYLDSPSSGTITVNGTATGASINFTPIPPGTYPITFTETGLLTGTGWTVTLSGAPGSSTSTTITFTEPNGSYAFVVGNVSGYSASPASGSLTVNGTAVSRTIAFTPTPRGSYNVTFTETGLPSGTSWSVQLGTLVRTSISATISFVEQNNTYSFTVGLVSGYLASPPSGNLTVNGADISQTIHFMAILPPVKYPVTFTESGLPAGTSWTVTLNGSTSTSSNGTLVFSELNGTYSFTIGGATGYGATPPSGTVQVKGAPVSQPIRFATPSPGYLVVFTETGLPSAVQWSVTLNGQTNSSRSNIISFSEPNGNYTFAVVAPSGYTAQPSSGSVAVKGAQQGVPVTFTPAKGTSTNTFLGLPGYEGYLLVGGVVVALGIALVVILGLRRPRTPSAPPEASKAKEQDPPTPAPE